MKLLNVLEKHVQKTTRVRCPNHYAVFDLMQCPRCRRVFEEHTMRIAKLPLLRRA